MERVLTPYVRRSRSQAAALKAAAPVTVLLPGAGAGEWLLIRRPAGGAVAVDTSTPLPPVHPAPDAGDAPPAGAPPARAPLAYGVTRQVFPSLEAAAENLQPQEDFHLGLPLDFGLVQRMTLPPAEPDELEEMARIQLEKILPYPIEEVGIAYQVIRRDETETVLSVQAVHESRLLEFCQPLSSRSRWPLRVDFNAVTVAEGAGADETSAFFYPEDGRLVLGICEGGRLSSAQTLDAESPDDLAAQLPALLLSAELEGVPTGFQFARLDERSAAFQPALAGALGVPVELFRAEPPPTPPPALNAALPRDLSPVGWRVERQRVLRRARLRRKLLQAGAVYLALLAVGFLVVGYMKLQVGRLDAKLAEANPQITKIKAAEARWKALSPAINPNHSVALTLLRVCEKCLPPNNAVRMTLFDQKLNSVEIRGEASSQASSDFTEKIKAQPEFRDYSFQASPPAVLPSGQVQFQIIGTRK